MNLMYLAQNGLSSAQASLNVVGNNLNNATTLGYNRQSIILGEAGGRTISDGFFGYGVKVNGVKRAYDGFINNQARGAETEFQAIQSRYQQVSQIDEMFGDTTNNISVAFGSIFESMGKMSSDPVSLAARQETYAQFNSISYKYQTSSKTLDGLEKSTNTQVQQSVNDINEYAKQLANLNSQIDKVYGQTGTLPADLLDQRDLVLDQLNDLVGIRVNENTTTGRVDVTIDNGLTLVNGDKHYALETKASDANPNVLEVSYVDASGNSMLLDESKFTTGKLGGLFKFRNDDLPQARNELNQIALQMANAFNEVNKQGYDLNGEAGENIFNIPDPVALANSQNTSNTSLQVTYTDITNVNATDYTLVFKGPTDTDWVVTTTDGRSVTPEIGDDGELLFEGISVKPSGTPEVGDSFQLNPVSGSGAGINVAISDGTKIAASNSSDIEDESNNENLKALIAIKDQKIVGNSTFTEAYASLVSSVGSSVSGLKADAVTTAKVCDQWAFQKQSVSGVDLNEEYINLQMFSQYYQANAQVLQTAITVFDTILKIR